MLQHCFYEVLSKNGSSVKGWELRLMAEAPFKGGVSQIMNKVCSWYPQDVLKVARFDSQCNNK